MTALQKRWLMGAGLVATLVLAWLAPQDETPQPTHPAPAQRAARAPAPSAGPAATDPLGVDAAPVVTPTRGASARVAAPAMRAEQLARPERAASAEVVNLFQATSWFIAPPPPPPPPPAPPPPPPPPPSAPPLPFVFLGQIIEDGHIQVILARGDRVVTAFVGDSIDKSYKVESLKGGTLTLVYLPLDTRQTLATGVSQ